MARIDNAWTGALPRPRRRWAWRFLWAVLVMAGFIGVAPTVVVATRLRDWPLDLVFAGIDGRMASGQARWPWFGPIEYRDLRVFTSDGRVLAVVPRLSLSRGLAGLLFDPSRLGILRVEGCQLSTAVWPGGSTVEQIMTPWLAAAQQDPALIPAEAPSFLEGWAGSRPDGRRQVAATPPTLQLEVVGATLELIDQDRNDTWWITDLAAMFPLGKAEGGHGWTVAGRVRHVGSPQLLLDSLDAQAMTESAAIPDQTSVATVAAAILARDGGWAVSAAGGPNRAAGADGAGPPLSVTSTRLPLGISSVLATRLASTHLLDGLADLRLEVIAPGGTAAGWGVAGSMLATDLAVCRSADLEERIRFDRLELPLDLTVGSETIDIRTFRAASPVVSIEAAGHLGLPDGFGPRHPAGESLASPSLADWAAAFAAEDFALTATVDLTAATRAATGLLAVRPDVQITSGVLEMTAAARGDGGSRLLEIRTAARDVTAIQASRRLAFEAPLTAWIRGRTQQRSRPDLVLEEARLSGPALEVSATTSAGSLAVEWTADLAELFASIAELLDLDRYALAGISRGRIDLAERNDGMTALKAAASMTNFSWQQPGRPAWQDAQLALEMDAAGRLDGRRLHLDSGEFRLESAADRCSATLQGATMFVLSAPTTAAAAGPWIVPATVDQPSGVAAECRLSGTLETWLPRLACLADGVTPASDAARPSNLAGRIDGSLTIASVGQTWQITRASTEIENLLVTLDGHRLEEPRLILSAAGTIEPTSGTLEISSAEVLSATASLRTGGLRVTPTTNPPGESGWLDLLLDQVRGRLQWQADVARLSRWLDMAGYMSAQPAGRIWGTVEVVEAPQGANLLVEATGSQISLTRSAESGDPQAVPVLLWREPQPHLVCEVTRPLATSSRDRLQLDRLLLESSTLQVSAAGGMADLTTRRVVDVGGTLAVNWEQCSRLLQPLTGGQVQLTGGTPRPFRLRGPLGPTPPADSTANTQKPVQTIRLPESWLNSSGADDRRQSRMVTVPERPARSLPTAETWLRPLTAETTLAWTGGAVAGLPVEPGELPLRLFEGQLALGPFDLGIAGGRIRGAPWLRLLPLPGEAVLPPGRAVDRMVLSPAICDRWLTWLSPLLKSSAHARGLLTIDCGGGRLPLLDPAAGEFTGAVLLEGFEVTPGELMGPLVKVIVNLQSVIDPRFAFGDKAVLLRARPEPIRVGLSKRRMHHEGLVLDMGQLTLRSGGSVGEDGSLDMVVELAFRGDIAGSTPVVAQLLRTPLAIPIRGTVSRPQFDAGAIDTTLRRIMENTADAVLRDGISRGLEAIFGNPQPQRP